MRIELKRLAFKDFKGFKDFVIEFDGDTLIKADNGLGKSSIIDGYLWLLWGKDSENKKDYKVKRSKMRQASVEGILVIDGKEISLKRIYKEVWTRKKGQLKEEFTGHRTELYINGLPKKLKDYEDYVTNIVASDDFQLLSNPWYFNSLDNKEKRKILLSLIEDVKMEDLSKIEPDLLKLDMSRGSIEDIQIKAKEDKRLINERLRYIPERIDELEKMKVYYDFNSLEEERKILDKKIKDIDISLASKSEELEIDRIKRDEIKALKDRLEKLEDEDRKKERDQEEDYQEKIKDIKNKISDLSFKKDETERRIEVARKNIERWKIDYIEVLEKDLERTRKDWLDESKKECQEDFICPTCGQDLPEALREDILRKFNKNKAESLEELSTRGTELKREIENMRRKIQSASLEIEKDEDRLKNIEEEINRLEISLRGIGKPKFIGNEEIKRLGEEIDKKIRMLGSSNNDRDSILKRKNCLLAKIDDIKDKLKRQEINLEIDERIENHKRQEEKLAKEFEDKEYILYLCDLYIKTYADFIEKDLNKIFSYVDFKLFDRQINGEMKEVAIPMVDGKEYGELNETRKLNVGLDIINSLAKQRDKYMPVMIDRAESYNHLIEVEGQLIKTRVTDDKKLVVERIER